MSTRNAAALAALVVTAAALVTATQASASHRAHRDSGAKPLAPAAANALATSGADGGLTATRAVDSATALAAGSLPGAQTWVEPGLSPGEAVGLGAMSSPASRSLARRLRLMGCWANAAWHQWGTWPYQQKLVDTTYWCAVYGHHITYRTSTATASGTLCSPGLGTSQLIGGGVGRRFRSFTIRSAASYSCATVLPWITIHKHHFEDIRRNDRGGTFVVRTD